MNKDTQIGRYPLLCEMLRIKELSLQPTYTIRDIAQLFGVTVRAIQARVAAGKLMSRDLPGRAKFLPVDVENFLAHSQRSCL